MCCFLCCIQNGSAGIGKPFYKMLEHWSTVGDIKFAHRFENEDSENELSRKHHRSAHYADMESPIFTRFTNARAQNIPISEAKLKTKVRQFGEEMGITEFSYSNGWLTRFKSRHGISSQIISGKVPVLIFSWFKRALKKTERITIALCCNADGTKS